MVSADVIAFAAALLGGVIGFCVGWGLGYDRGKVAGVRGVRQLVHERTDEVLVQVRARVLL